ncbi:MAG: 16S rRNA pseudouridine(516) synthase [Clostridiales bacterium]|nr:16S rRNA pseudouridine(516) synthase [Clostridiales bacterium]
MSKERLDKLIASQGKVSRKDVKQFIRTGRVSVNGKPAIDPGNLVDIYVDTIEIDGKEFDYRSHIYIMMNKPSGVLSASLDKKAVTVIDLVPEELQRKNLFPAGRLDKDTTGFMLITDDGDFSHKILSPKNHVVKTYEAKIKYDITDSDIKRFEEGIVLEDGTECMSAKLERLGEKYVRIQICEGKFHQIKRMVATLNNEVIGLKRTKIGGLELDPALEPGECREITGDELIMITGTK